MGLGGGGEGSEYSLGLKREGEGRSRRGIILSCVFRNIDPPPPHRPASVYPPSLVRGEGTIAEWRGGGRSIVLRMPDTALYSIFVSTSWVES
jgi:hypothetical protein